MCCLPCRMWFLLESCAFDFFFNQSRKVAQARAALVYSGRESQPLSQKLSLGATLFVVLLGIILGPAVLFSTLNPFLERNPVGACAFLVYGGACDHNEQNSFCIHAVVGHWRGIQSQPRHTAGWLVSALLHLAP